MTTLKTLFVSVVIVNFIFDSIYLDIYIMAKRWRDAANAFGRVNWAKEISYTALDVLKFVGIFHVASYYGVNFTKCIGPSMEPTFNAQGDYVLIDNFSYRVRQKPYKSGDVVICICPYDSTKTVCKRITATAGDLVVVRENEHIKETTVIPPGHVWLAGDNCHNSTDSRTYGPVSAGLLRGRVFLKLGSLKAVESKMPPPTPPPPPARRQPQPKP